MKVTLNGDTATEYPRLMFSKRTEEVYLELTEDEAVKLTDRGGNSFKVGALLTYWEDVNPTYLVPFIGSVTLSNG